MKILIADKFEQAGMDDLKDLGCTIEFQPDLTTDDLQVNTLAPPDERTFSPGFNAPRSMIAHFDNVFKNGLLYDDFESDFDPEKWEWQPPEVVSNETQTVAPGTITVDGDPSDWAGLIMALDDPQGDSSGGSGADIEHVYTAMDDTYAYVMVETYNYPISPDATHRDPRHAGTFSDP